MFKNRLFFTSVLFKIKPPMRFEKDLNTFQHFILRSSYQQAIYDLSRCVTFPTMIDSQIDRNGIKCVCIYICVQIGYLSLIFLLLCYFLDITKVRVKFAIFICCCCYGCEEEETREQKQQFDMENTILHFKNTAGIHKDGMIRYTIHALKDAIYSTRLNSIQNQLFAYNEENVERLKKDIEFF